MAALSAVLRLVRNGEHVVAGDDIYGGTSRLLTRVAPDLGISVTNVSTTETECGPLTCHMHAALSDVSFPLCSWLTCLHVACCR